MATSIKQEIEKIQANKVTIKNKLINFKLVDSTAKLADCATAIDGIVNRGTVNAEVTEGNSVTINPGYYEGGTIQGVAGGGNYSLQAKEVTPTKSAQPITADEGYYGLSSVSVGAIPAEYQDVTSVNAAASEVLLNKTIVAADGSVVIGTMPNIGKVTKTLDTTTTSTTIAKGYHDGTGTVSITTETKSATPTKDGAQDITPSTGKVLSKVTVAAIPATWFDAAEADATAADILSGTSAVTADGLTAGTMPNQGEPVITLGNTNQYYTIQPGYYSGGTIGIMPPTAQTFDAPSPGSEALVYNVGNKALINKVTVNPIPSTYADASATTVSAGTLLSGTKAIGKDSDGNAVTVTGTMPNNGATSLTIDGLNSDSVDIPAGYTTGGSVSLTGDILAALQEI